MLRVEDHRFGLFYCRRLNHHDDGGHSGGFRADLVHLHERLLEYLIDDDGRSLGLRFAIPVKLAWDPNAVVMPMSSSACRADSDCPQGVPVLDAYLWVKTPGQSDGSCDIAGGARACDYSRYNPSAVSGSDAQSHFDPLWGQVGPAAGAWFPAQALDLVENANPPLL